METVQLILLTQQNSLDGTVIAHPYARWASAVEQKMNIAVLSTTCSPLQPLCNFSNGVLPDACCSCSCDSLLVQNFVRMLLQVLYLNSRSRPDMPRFIEGVPTLVLDYDKHIDMSRDIDAKQFYATQVKAYFHFVKALRDKKAE